ncbi:hypothetical protein M0802_009668 [Mischocyttarus mexicanus]|nr:hypothetical protein M0802_009668 [Mischocyttarus mexicanus]
MKVVKENMEYRTKTSKIDVTYPWADTKRSSLGYHICKTLYKYVSLYCEQSALVGYKYLVEPRRTWAERIIWIAVHLTTICILVYFVIDAYSAFATLPMVTSVESDHYPTSEITFPEILELLEQLGDIYNSMKKLEEDRRNELNQLLLDFYEEEYDVDTLMKELTPECSIMLLKCLFNGNEHNCSDIFSFEKTHDGYCCTFNYITKSNSNDDDEPIEVKTVKDLGIERGLTVVMEPSLDDYFYTFLPVVGWKVTLFNPTDYPDNISGGVTEVLVSPLLESYLEIEAVSFHSTDQTKSYPIPKRKCIFPNEIQTRYGDYSYSDCLVDCREQQIWKMCKCIPFYLPTRTEVNSKHGRRACTLTDLKCLTRYKSKWLAVFPHEDKTLNNTVREYNLLHCGNCYPSCQDVFYTIQSSFSTMKRGYYKTSLLNNIEIIDQSVIHVFFSKYGTVRLKQDISYTWYELLSK